MVVVEKTKTRQIRICLNILIHQFEECIIKCITIDDVISKLNGVTKFSLVDITHAYWSVKLDKESSLLTIFSRHLGDTDGVVCHLELQQCLTYFTQNVMKYLGLTRRYKYC